MRRNVGDIPLKQLRAAIDRLTAIEYEYEITERGDGFLRGWVTCAGTCGDTHLNSGRHDVIVRHDRFVDCDCPATQGLCYHIAAILVGNDGQFPEAPTTCEAHNCGSDIFYMWDGDGHGPRCPKHNKGEPFVKAGAPRTVVDEAPPSAPATAVPLASGRQKVIDKTRPVLQVANGTIEVFWACGHRAFHTADKFPGRFTLPLSPLEGCPVCNDHMRPPAPDQVRARQEAQ